MQSTHRSPSPPRSSRPPVYSTPSGRSFTPHPSLPVTLRPGRPALVLAAQMAMTDLSRRPIDCLVSRPSTSSDPRPWLARPLEPPTRPLSTPFPLSVDTPVLPVSLHPQGVPARARELMSRAVLPLFSQAVPALPASLFADEEKLKALTTRVQFGGDEVVAAKAGAGSATLSMAYG